MKVLVLNGSPHNNGDTAYILNRIKVRFPSNTIYEEIKAYYSDIVPCNDCRYCWNNIGCSKKDQMDLILKDDYEVVIIASPVYMSFVTPPLFSIFTRFNFMYSNKHFMNQPYTMNNKKGILVLTGGGDGSPDDAIKISKNIFKKLNANFDIDKDYIYSLNTDTLPASEDSNINNLIDKCFK